MRRVLKWDVPVNDQPAAVGSGPVVHIGVQGDIAVVQIWTDETMPDDVPSVSRMVQVFGTGHPVPADAVHLGSVVTAGGALVWHVFEVHP